MTVRTTVLPEEVRLDILTRDLLGTEGRGHVEALLDRNQGLAAAAPYLGAGTAVDVPDAAPTTRVLPSVNPWE